MTAAKKTTGLTFTFGGTACAELVNIVPPGKSRAKLDATNFDTVGDVEEFLKGVKSLGECTLVFNHIPTDPGQLALTADVDDDDETVTECVITFPFTAAYALTFDAFVSGWKPPSGKKGDIMQLEVTLTVSGDAEFAAV